MVHCRVVQTGGRVEPVRQTSVGVQLGGYAGGLQCLGVGDALIAEWISTGNLDD